MNVITEIKNIRLVREFLRMVFGIVLLLSQTLCLAQNFGISVQPPDTVTVCGRGSLNHVTLSVTARSCDFHVLTYQWQKLRPAEIGGDSVFRNIESNDIGYSGQNSNRLEIPFDSSGFDRNYYQYRCGITSIGPVSANCAPIQNAYSRASHVILIYDSILVGYKNPINDTACERINKDHPFRLDAVISGLTPDVTYTFTWSMIDQFPDYLEKVIATQNIRFRDSARLKSKSALERQVGFVFPDSLRTIKHDKNFYYLTVSGKGDCKSIDKQNAVRVNVDPIPRIEIPDNTFEVKPNQPVSLFYRIAFAHNERPGMAVSWSYKVRGDAGLMKYVSQSNLEGTGNRDVYLDLPSGHGLPEGMHTLEFYNMQGKTGKDACVLDTTYSLTLWVSPNANSIPTGNASLQIHLLPNPGNGFINISVLDKTKLNIFSQQGTWMSEHELTAGNNPLDIRSLPPGVYYMQCVSGDKSACVRYIKIQ